MIKIKNNKNKKSLWKTKKIVLTFLIIFVIINGLFFFRIGLFVYKNGKKLEKKVEERDKEKEYFKNIEQYALEYYKKKYNIDVDVQNVSEIVRGIDCSDICSHYAHDYSVLLDNGDEIFYDYEKKQFADNREYDLIISELNSYYNNIFEEMKKEFEMANEYVYFNKNIDIESYGLNSNYANELQTDKKKYFHTSYSNIKDFVKDENVSISSMDNEIICEKNSNCQNIVSKYATIINDRFPTRKYIELELHDVSDYKIYEKDGKTVVYVNKSEPFAVYTITTLGVQLNKTS